MLNETEIEEFLRRFAERVREVGGNEASLQHLIREGVQELQSKWVAGVTEPSEHLGAVEDTANQVNRLPTPPKAQEDPADVFEPQRDTTPG